MPALVKATVVLLSLSIFVPETIAQFSPELSVVNRNTGSNDITLECRVRTPDGPIVPLQGAKFYVNETTKDLITLLTVQSIPYTSEEEGRIEFLLPQDLEANYLCGLNSTYVSTSRPLLHYPRRDPIQLYYARATGSSVTMKCGVSEGALAESYTVVWRKGFRILDTSDSRFTLRRERGEDYSLTISGLQVSDSANYTCDVAVEFANAYYVPDAFVKLLVYAEPDIAVSPVDTTSLAEDNTVSFTCEATGYPSPDIQWYHNQNLIVQSRGNSVSSKYAINSTSLDGGGTIHSTISIMDSLSLADSGEVTCEARIQYQDELREVQSPITTAIALLNVLDDSFSIQTIVTQDHDLLPQLTLSAPLPSLTTLVLRYSPTNGSTAVDQSSSSAYFSVSRIFHFVPNSFIPSGITTFRLQVALRVNDVTGPFTPKDVSQANVIDINVPSEDEECDRISDTIIIIITGTSAGVIVTMSLLATLCVYCYVRNWGRVEKLPNVVEYRRQLSDERDKVRADDSIPEEEKKKRVEGLDKKIDKIDHRIGRLVSDSGGEVVTDMNAAGGIRQEEAVQGNGEGMPMIRIEPGQEGRR